MEQIAGNETRILTTIQEAKPSYLLSHWRAKRVTSTHVPCFWFVITNVELEVIDCEMFLYDAIGQAKKRVCGEEEVAAGKLGKLLKLLTTALILICLIHQFFHLNEQWKTTHMSRQLFSCKRNNNKIISALVSRFSSLQIGGNFLMISVFKFFNLTKESTGGGRMRNGANTMRVHTRRVGSCCWCRCWIRLSLNSFLDIIKLMRALLTQLCEIALDWELRHLERLTKIFDERCSTRAQKPSQLSNYGRVLNLRLVSLSGLLFEHEILRNYLSIFDHRSFVPRQSRLPRTGFLRTSRLIGRRGHWYRQLCVRWSASGFKPSNLLNVPTFWF